MKDSVISQHQSDIEQIKKAMATEPSLMAANKAMQCLDLTSLTGHETEGDIHAICRKAKDSQVAAVCFYPEWMAVAAEELADTEVARACAIHFPYGDKTNDGDIATVDNTIAIVNKAADDGATEIDIVIDYKPCRDDMDETNARRLLRACCETASKRGLKVKAILETAFFEFDDEITAAAQMAMECGADFIKTSTGKYADPEFPDHNGGATPQAVLAMLRAIQAFHAERPVGLKISGGVNNGNYAGFIKLVEGMRSDGFIKPDTFRFGASGVYDDLRLTIKTHGVATADRTKRQQALNY